jgi:magnesium transporter
MDLIGPSDEERAEAARVAGVRIPTREALSEIESSSRAFVEGATLYLSTPLIAAAGEESPVLLPLGFVLDARVLVTVRFAPAKAFDVVHAGLESSAGTLAPAEIFARLLEAMVDRAADRLEGEGAGLDALSQRIFAAGGRQGKADANDRLRDELRRIGRAGDGLSKVRDTLLGLHRITGFSVETPIGAIGPDVVQRLSAVHGDIVSLNSYEEHLSTKVQFLLDATLGFINIEQNDVVKILTVVSVVGVPPVLIAGIYGMNFKRMPEYDWTFGYPYSLGLMAVSAIVPYLWFKWRKWL